MNALGVELVVKDVSSHPHCAHGPTLLFERFTLQQRNSQRFYACSACRDRKDCPFFQLADENGECVSGRVKKLKTEGCVNDCDLDEQNSWLEKIKNLPEKQRVFCNDCKKFVLPGENRCNDAHKIVKNISNELLQTPSFILTPLVNTKKEAQFFFSKKTVDFLFKTIQNLGYEKIICVGCPRLHEFVISQQKTNIKSFLLDFDSRFECFFNPTHFSHYNIFNHYFFRQDKQNYLNFLSNSPHHRLLLILDPPFGGLVDALSNSIKLISRDWRLVNDVKDDDEVKILDTFWIFPFFLEKRITECLPSLKMLDYQVDYDNHPLFKKGGEKSVRKSPVRIFTNIGRERFKLPEEDGYRFCSICRRFVAEENKHCEVCGDCTSKDGHTYNHCNRCNRCVKHTKRHCVTCNSCFPPDHICKPPTTMTGCHICGDITHKRKQCPSRINPKLNKYKSKRNKLKSRLKLKTKNKQKN